MRLPPVVEQIINSYFKNFYRDGYVEFIILNAVYACNSSTLATYGNLGNRIVASDF